MNIEAREWSRPYSGDRGPNGTNIGTHSGLGILLVSMEEDVADQAQK